MNAVHPAELGRCSKGKRDPKYPDLSLSKPQTSPPACSVALEGTGGFEKLFLPLMVPAQVQQC